MTEQVSGQLPWFSGSHIASLVSADDAIAALEDALGNGHDPAQDPARSVVNTKHGQLLLMPAESKASVGVKIASISPDNPRQGLPRIQAIYILLDSVSMSPLALLEGTALTTLRTSAVSALAAKYLSAQNSRELLVFGSGPQARAHIDSLRAIRALESISIVARTQLQAEELAQYVSDQDLKSRVILASDSESVAKAVSNSDIVVCATTSTTPVFSGRQVSAGACVIALGSHEPNVREVDADLVGRSLVFVEDKSTALRECGDIVMAIEEGYFEAKSLISLSELVNNPHLANDQSRPKLFKSSGMAWEDLVVAERIFRGSR